MITKYSSFASYTPFGDPLMSVINGSSSVGGLEKTAGCHPEILKFKHMLQPEPDKTYVHILALGAGDYYGPNLNNDYFNWSGLAHDCTTTPHQHLHGYKTFLNAHSFAHHVNKDPAKSYGDVILSVLNNGMKRVELIVAIDHARCERNGGKDILQKIHDGQYPATSMGCRVPYDECSICGNKAKTREEYCEHMKSMPGKILDDGRKVFVYNQFPRFFDISFVFIGADRTSFVLEKVANREGIFVPPEYGQIKESSTRLSKLLRAQTGLRQDSLQIKIRHKVQKQQRMTPKLLTFGKTQKLLSDPQQSQLTMTSGPLIFTQSPSTSMGAISKSAAAEIGKFADAEKLSEIFKRVNSLPMGRAVPLREGREDEIPDEVLDMLASRGDPSGTLGGLGSAGIALRPPEFQRFMLRSHGRPDMAEQLRGVTFRPHAGPPSGFGVRTLDRAPGSIFSALGPYLEERSTLSPVAVRRITIISARPPSPMGLPTMSHPVLDKLSSAYDSYRTSLLMQSEGLMKAAYHTPEIMSMVNDVRGVPFEGGQDVIHALSMIPIAYFTNAYWDRRCGCGMSDEEFVAEFVRCNPELAKYLAKCVARGLHSTALMS